jgi:ABC-2 type transport system ATP-binding protein
VSATVVDAVGVSKWYGPVMGVSDVTYKLSGGIVGLLGPNGAGKSTLIKMMGGLLQPSRGTLNVFGQSPFFSLEARRRIGYAPEHESTWDELTGFELVRAMARLAGVDAAHSKKAAQDALEAMGMTAAMHRRVRGYSKGMRQRTKLATAIAHGPDFLLLDEPLTGVDPMARTDIIARIRALGDAGKTVVVSSHVLYEIEALTTDILVIYRGQVLAEGNIQGIRQLIDHHPHRIRVECDRPRALVHQLAASDHVVSMTVERGACIVETKEPDRCYDELATAILETGIEFKAMTSQDNNLSAVFDYLTGGPS